MLRIYIYLVLSVMSVFWLLFPAPHILNLATVLDHSQDYFRFMLSCALGIWLEARSQHFVTLATDGHSGTTYMMKHIYNFLPEICILSAQSLYVCSSLESVLILRSPKNSTTLVNIQTLPEVYTFMEELAVEKPCWWISSMNRVLWKRNKEFTFTNLCWMFTTVSEYENV